MERRVVEEEDEDEDEDEGVDRRAKIMKNSLRRRRGRRIIMKR